MTVETRTIAPLEDLIAVELTCTRPMCGFVHTLRVEHLDLAVVQACPRCGEPWWNPKVNSLVQRLLFAIWGIQHGASDDGAKVAPDGVPVAHAPKIGFVFPG